MLYFYSEKENYKNINIYYRVKTPKIRCKKSNALYKSPMISSSILLNHCFINECTHDTGIEKSAGNKTRKNK